MELDNSHPAALVMFLDAGTGFAAPKLNLHQAAASTDAFLGPTSMLVMLATKTHLTIPERMGIVGDRLRLSSGERPNVLGPHYPHHTYLSDSVAVPNFDCCTT